jgi:hypothetical protein
MGKSVATLTIPELKRLIANAVEEKLLEVLGDPDAGQQIRADVRARLLRQRKAVLKGERGKPLAEVVKSLGLE